MTNFTRLRRIDIDQGHKPWLKVSSPSSISLAQLCECCAVLDFRVLMCHPFTHYRYPQTHGVNYPGPHELAVLKHVQESMFCVFCQLIWHGMQVSYGDRWPSNQDLDAQGVQVELFSAAHGAYGLQDMFTPTDTAYAIRMEAAVRAKDNLGYAALRKQPPLGVLIHAVQVPGNSSTAPLQGLVVSTSSPRWLDIGSWLRHCTYRHQESCNEHFSHRARGTQTRRLIDVSQKCIIDMSVADIQPQYATLSYVWGKEQFITLHSDTVKYLSTPGVLSSENDVIPRTICDAIIVCMELKTPFLWVDALCIKQDDQLQKREDIDSMDMTYARSHYNIVAVDGEHADAGLAGISRPRKEAQHVTCIDGLQLTNVLPSQRDVVDSSAWTTRGWTYQERLLSRRSLFFTETQVYFQCLEMDCSEDIQFDSSDDFSQFAGEERYRSLSCATIAAGDTDFQVYAEIVKEYSSRCLTHDSDVLNALSGIWRVMEGMFHHSSFFMNMPLALLDAAILWQPMAPLVRRACLVDSLPVPSWSWAGWIGSVHYFEATMNVAERLLTPDWTLLSSNFPARPGQWSEETSRPGWERSFGDYGASYVPLDVKSSSSVLARPNLSDASSLLQSGLITKERFLKFVGHVAEFNITLAHMKHSTLEHAGRCSGQDHVQHSACPLVIYDRDGAHCGYVAVDANTFLALQPGLYSFVRLSQTTLIHTEDDPAWDDSTQAFSRSPGLPGDGSKYDWVSFSGKPEKELYFDNQIFDPTIAWCLYNVMMVEWKGSVAYRLGIGAIHITAYDESSPVVREVLLG